MPIHCINLSKGIEQGYPLYALLFGFDDVTKLMVLPESTRTHNIRWHVIIYCKSGYFRACNFLRFSDF